MAGSRVPQVMTEEEILRILAIPDLKTMVGLRDRAILELLYSTGIRRRELSNLNVSDIDFENGYLRINCGKYYKDRVVPVGEVACKFIEAYLKTVRWWFLRDPKEDALFLDSQRGKRLSVSTIHHIIKKTVKKSGVKKRISAHTFRHSMATHLLHNKADIRYIQLILGHASLSSTEIYTHLVIDDLKEIHRRAHPHGRRTPDSDS
jgi:integrase/recombinase XerD